MGLFYVTEYGGYNGVKANEICRIKIKCWLV